MNLSFTLTKLLLTVLAVVLFGALFFAFSTTGSTFIGVTITTQPDLERGLVGHWTFDGPDITADQILDRSGQGNHGGFFGGATTSATAIGKIGQALEFDGVDDYVLPSSAPSATDYTYSAWFFARSFTNGSPGGGDGTFFFDRSIGVNAVISIKASGGNFVHQYRDDAGGGSAPNVSGGAIQLNTWQHVVWGRDNGNEFFIYVDNVKAANPDSEGTLTPPIPKLGGHTSNCPGTGCFDGIIDDVRIYNRALSAAEIKRLYNLGATTKIAKTINTQPDLERGLVGHWTFDGPDITTDQILDRSTQGNHGGFIGGATTSAAAIGRIGQGFEFDGVDDYVDAGSDSSIDDVFAGGGSLAAWVKLESLSLDPRIIDKGENIPSGWSFMVNDDAGSARLMFRHTFDGTDGQWDAVSTLLTLGEWHHVAVAYNRDSTTTDPILYIDGTSISIIERSTPSGTADSDAAQPVRIGTRDPNARFWPGLLDDVRVYNRTLSAAEIKRLYNLGATTKIAKTINTQPALERGLVGHWTFDGPDMVSNVADRSGQNNNGGLVNVSTSSATTIGKIGQAVAFNDLNTDEFIQIEHDATLTGFTSLTLSAWIYPQGDPGDDWGRIIHKDFGGSSDSYSISYKGGSSGGCPQGSAQYYVGFRIRTVENDVTDTTMCSNSQILPNTGWRHVLGIWDGATSTIYIDGIEDAAKVATGTLDDQSLPLGIGGHVGSGWPTRWYDGAIDDVRIYNRALSQDEISRLYEMGR